MISPRLRSRPAVVLTVSIAVVLGATACLLIFRDQPQNGPDSSTSTKDFPLPPRSVSPYRNTGASVAFTGSDACSECHTDEAASWSQTGMSASMSRISNAAVFDTSTLDHRPSGRRYEVIYDNASLIHRESMIPIDEASTGELISEHRVEFVVGSGARFNMFLCEPEEFLVESPLTWYLGDSAVWDMSPGYDQPFNPGFQRAITEECLFCHAGRAERVDDSYHRIRFHELAIGCERCHGPGSLHVEQRKSNTASGSEDIDYTIVNPARLPRELAEDICHQCHRATKSYVTVRGRSISNYRPGLPLDDFRQYFKVAGQTDETRVVGHVEQQLKSRCYQESKTLTCVTCHNPHTTPDNHNSVEFYRNVCLDCHADQGCAMAPEIRLQKSPDDNCVKCHMPAVQTKTLHVAATNHRIGIHHVDDQVRAAASPSPKVAPELLPISDESKLEQIDRRRNLGLAYVNLVFHLGMGSSPDADAAWQHGRRLLIDIHASGMRDGDIEATLAHLSWEIDRDAAAAFARSALARDMLSPDSRVNSLFALADNHFRRREMPQALRYARELIRIRRNAADRTLMGQIYAAQRNPEAAIREFEHALTIDSNLIDVHESLIRLYAAGGNTAEIRKHTTALRRIKEVASRAARWYHRPDSANPIELPGKRVKLRE